MVFESLVAAKNFATVWHPFLFLKRNTNKQDNLAVVPLANLSEGTEELVIVPYNINNNHWVLFTLNMQTHGCGVFDPMAKQEDLPDAMRDWLTENSSDQWQWNVEYKFPHHHQNDTSSCGGWVVWYAKQLCAGRKPDEVFQSGNTLDIKNEIQEQCGDLVRRARIRISEAQGKRLQCSSKIFRIFKEHEKSRFEKNK